MIQAPPTADSAPHVERYRITRLLVPETLPPDERAPEGPAPEEPTPDRRRPRRAWVWALSVLLLSAIVTTLPGGRAAVSVPRSTERPAPRPVSLPEGEWLRIVGPEPVPDEPRPAAMGLALRPRSEPRASLKPIWAEALWWDISEPLSSLLQIASRVGAQARLAQAGGVVRLMSGYAPPWMWAMMGSSETPLPIPILAVTLPPALDGFAHHTGQGAWVEGVNYTDPLGIGLPLLNARGFETARISSSFTVGDFATRDGAPYVRIAANLVSGLEQIRSLLGPITVISGYRHPRYNALPSVGGHRFSRHQAGQAADVWSPSMTSLEIARAAVQAMGCGIGLGLGRNTVHVDVRGFLSTWTYPGAPLSEATFDRWILQLCGGSGPVPQTPRSSVLDANWLALVEGERTDEEEVVHLSDKAVEETLDRRSVVVVPERESLDIAVRRTLARFAQTSYARSGPGVVIVDLQDGASVFDVDLVERARYARAESPEVLLLNVRHLAAWAKSQPEQTVFVYAVRLPAGRIDTGVAPTAPAPTAPAPTALAPAAKLPALSPVEPVPVAPRAQGASWLVVHSARTSLAGAEADLRRYAAALTGTGLTPILHVTRAGGALRYNVATGPFGTSDEATAARDRAAPYLPVPGELVRIDE